MNEQEDLLEGLEVVRACGCANMFDRQSVARLLEDFGYLEEYEVLKNMSPSQYIKLLSVDFSEHLNGKNN